MEESVNSNFAAVSNGEYLTASALAWLLVSNQSIISSSNTSSVQLRSHQVENATLKHESELSVVSWNSNVSFGNTPIYIPRCGDCVVVNCLKTEENIHNSSDNTDAEEAKIIPLETECSFLSSSSSSAAPKAELTTVLWQWIFKDKIKYLMKSNSNPNQKQYAALFRYNCGSSYTSTHAIANTYHYLSEIDAPWRSESTCNNVKKGERESWRVELLQKHLVRWVINYFTHHSSNTRVLSVKQIETAWPLLLLFSTEKRLVLIQHAIEHYGGDALRFYNNTIIRVFNATSFILSPIEPFDQRVMRANELNFSTVISACGAELYALVNALNHLTNRFHSGHLTSSRAVAMAYGLCCQLLCSLHESSMRRGKHKTLCHVVRHNMYSLTQYFYKAISINNRKNNNNFKNIKTENNKNDNINKNKQTEAQYILYGLHSVLHVPEPLPVTPTQQSEVSSLPRKNLDESDLVMKVQDAICNEWKEYSEECEHHMPECNKFAPQKENVTLQTQRYLPHETESGYSMFARQLEEYEEEPSLQNNNYNHHIIPSYNSSNGDFFHEPSAFFAPSEAPQTSLQHTLDAVCIDCTKLNTRRLPMSELNMIMSNMSTASEINKHILSVLSATVNEFIMPDNWVEAKHTESAQEPKLQLFIGKRKHKTSMHNDEVDSESTSKSDDSDDASVYYTRAKPKTAKFASSERAEHYQRLRHRRRRQHTRQNQL